MDEEIRLMREAQERREGRVYVTLTKMVEWLMGRELKGSTIRNYVSGVKGYLLDGDVTIDPYLFRRRVKIPLSYPIPETPLDKPTILLLCRNAGDPRLRTLIYLLASSGVRLQEALMLRMRDTFLDESPPRVMLAGQITKTGKPREAYMTREAVQEVKNLHRKPDEYIFSWMDVDTSGKVRKGSAGKVAARKGPEGFRIWLAEKKATAMLRRLSKKLGLERNVAEGHRFHTIHFHNFRKFFFTTTAGIAGEGTAHYLAGHQDKLGMYDLGLTDRLRTVYREKLEKALTISEPLASLESVDDLRSQVQKLQDALTRRDVEIEKLRQLWDTTMDDRGERIKTLESLVTRYLKSQGVDVDKALRDLRSSKEKVKGTDRKEVRKENG